jgi:predicted RNase H-like HicB family nuclease
MSIDTRKTWPHSCAEDEATFVGHSPEHRKYGWLDRSEGSELMIRYIGILEKEPGTLWGICFPDLPGCITAAETAEQALDQAPDALRLWVDDTLETGEKLPKARTIEELRQDIWVAEAIAKGHAAVVFSLPPEEEVFDDETLRAIDEAAERRGMSRTAFLRETILEKIAG